MVNTLTGDLNLSLPLLKVPGPEGGFEIPIFYNASIGLEQDASWVGLGWNINVGAINRSIIQFPDDAKGQVTEIIKKDDILRGWTSNMGPLQMGWNTNTGHSGRFSFLGVESTWSKGGRSFTVGGVGVTNGSFGVDPVKLAMFAIDVATIATAGAGEVAGAFAKAAAWDAGTSFAISSMTDITPSLPIEGYVPVTKTVNQKFFHKDFWYFIDEERADPMYGSLYLHDIPRLPSPTDEMYIDDGQGNRTAVQAYYNPDTPGMGGVGDFHVDFEGTRYKYDIGTISPSSMAKDKYRVMAPGIGGSIEPYRLETGSISLPRDLSEDHLRMAVIPFEDYKVQFKYKDLFSNSYGHHAGRVDGEMVDTSDPKYGFDYAEDGDNVVLSLSDPTLEDERLEPTRDGLAGDYLQQALDVQWYSNEEITTLTPYAEGYLDVYPQIERTFFRDGLRDEGVGAFVITAADGMRYYFSLPVYEADYFAKTQVKEDDDAYTTIDRSDAYAVTWLLTAMVGPDFKDLNGDGMPNAGDHGRWVRFEYGKFSDSFNWRYPYSHGTVDYRLGEDNEVRSYQEGVREQYYLDAVHTRTHVALFIKDLREDGKGAFDGNGIASSSARLDEIMLLRQEDYHYAVNSLGLDKSNNASYNTLIKAVGSGDSFTNIWDREDLTSSYDHLLERSLQSVRFKTSYKLSDKAANSFDNSLLDNGNLIDTDDLQGKLTLDSIALYGQEGDKYYDNYQFSYAHNPDYSSDKWDAWGLYNPDGDNEDVNSHNPSDDDDDAASWSLTTMITPTGNRMDIAYERDSYSSVAGKESYDKVDFADKDWRDGIRIATKDIPKLSGVNQIKINVSVQPPYGEDDDISDAQQNYLLDATINTINGRDVMIVYSTTEVDISFEDETFVYGTILIPNEVKGGDLRVKQIAMSGNGGESYKTVYRYNAGDVSSGSVSKEPSFIKSEEFDWQKYYDYPQTPVMYSKVEVLNGLDPAQEDYDVLSVFEFEMPDENTVQWDPLVQATTDNTNPDRVYQYANYLLHINAAKVGRIKSTRVYGAHDPLNPVNSRVYEYADISDNQQGLFTEGTLLTETLFHTVFDENLVPIDTDGDGDDDSFENQPIERDVQYNRFFRTTKVWYPSILSKITTTNREGIVSTEDFTDWDFISGQVTQSESRSGTGLQTRSVTVPAYTIDKYMAMGPRGSVADGRHMLTQSAEEYVYKINNAGDIVGLINASANRWEQTWSEFRELNGDLFEDVDDTSTDYRKLDNYSWRGVSEALIADGTKAFDVSADLFNHDTPDANKWQAEGEITRYDKYSMPLESKDKTNIYSALKMGYDLAYPIMESSNAKYEEIAFSGAEEAPNSTTGYFAGEVKAGGIRGNVDDDAHLVHTGDYSLKTTGSEEVFAYKTDKLVSGRKYRLMAWTTDANGSIQYSINDGPIHSILTKTQRKAGDWYQISGIVEIPVGVTTLEAWCKGTGAIAYYDDFRLQPLTSSAQAKVYDRFGQVTYTLDNNNLFSHTQYDKQGRPIRVWQETFDPDQPKYKVWEKIYNQGTPFYVHFGSEGDGLERINYGRVGVGVEPYTYVWTKDGVVDPTAIGPEYPSGECFSLLHLKVTDALGRTQEHTFNQDYIPLEADLVLSYTIDESKTFRTNFTGGTPPYQIDWYNEGVLAHTELDVTTQFGYWTQEFLCDIEVYAKVYDACNNDVTTNQIIHLAPPVTNVEVTPKVSSPKSFEVTYEGGISVLIEWFIDGSTDPHLPCSGFADCTLTEECSFSIAATVRDFCDLAPIASNTAYYSMPNRAVVFNGEDDLANPDIFHLEITSVTGGASNKGYAWTLNGASHLPETPMELHNIPKECDPIDVVLKVTDDCGDSDFYYTIPAKTTPPITNATLNPGNLSDFQQTFTSSVQGGSGDFTYSWSGGGAGTSKTYYRGCESEDVILTVTDNCTGQMVSSSGDNIAALLTVTADANPDLVNGFLEIENVQKIPSQYVAYKWFIDDVEQDITDSYFSVDPDTLCTNITVKGRVYHLLCEESNKLDVFTNAVIESNYRAIEGVEVTGITSTSGHSVTVSASYDFGKSPYTTTWRQKIGDDPWEDYTGSSTVDINCRETITMEATVTDDCGNSDSGVMDILPYDQFEAVLEQPLGTNHWVIQSNGGKGNHTYLWTLTSLDGTSYTETGDEFSFDINSYCEDVTVTTLITDEQCGSIEITNDIPSVYQDILPSLVVDGAYKVTASYTGGRGNPTYQWERKIGSGAWQTYTDPTPGTPDALPGSSTRGCENRYYRVTISDECTTVTSNEALVIGFTNIVGSERINDDLSWTIDWVSGGKGTAFLSYDWKVTGLTTGTVYSNSFNSSGSSLDLDPYVDSFCDATVKVEGRIYGGCGDNHRVVNRTVSTYYSPLSFIGGGISSNASSLQYTLTVNYQNGQPGEDITWQQKNGSSWSNLSGSSTSKTISRGCSPKYIRAVVSDNCTTIKTAADHQSGFTVPALAGVTATGWHDNFSFEIRNPMNGGGNYQYRWRITGTGVDITQENQNYYNIDPDGFCTSSLNVKGYIRSQCSTSWGNAIVNENITTYYSPLSLIGDGLDISTGSTSYTLTADYQNGSPGTSFQWQEKIGSSWVNLSGSASTKSISRDCNDRYVRLIISDNCTSIATASDASTGYTIPALPTANATASYDLDNLLFQIISPTGGDGTNYTYRWQVLRNSDNTVLYTSTNSAPSTLNIDPSSSLYECEERLRIKGWVKSSCGDERLIYNLGANTGYEPYQADGRSHNGNGHFTFEFLKGLPPYRVDYTVGGTSAYIDNIVKQSGVDASFTIARDCTDKTVTVTTSDDCGTVLGSTNYTIPAKVLQSTQSMTVTSGIPTYSVSPTNVCGNITYKWRLFELPTNMPACGANPGGQSVTLCNGDDDCGKNELPTVQTGGSYVLRCTMTDDNGTSCEDFFFDLDCDSGNCL